MATLLAGGAVSVAPGNLRAVGTVRVSTHRQFYQEPGWNYIIYGFEHADFHADMFEYIHTPPCDYDSDDEAYDDAYECICEGDFCVYEPDKPDETTEPCDYDSNDEAYDDAYDEAYDDAYECICEGYFCIYELTEN